MYAICITAKHLIRYFNHEKTRYNIFCTTIHRYPIFSTGYSVMCKVYTVYCGTSEIEHGLCACTVDNPLAKARGLSLRTGAQTMLYLSLEGKRRLSPEKKSYMQKKKYQISLWTSIKSWQRFPCSHQQSVDHVHLNWQKEVKPHIQFSNRFITEAGIFVFQ